MRGWRRGLLAGMAIVGAAQAALAAESAPPHNVILFVPDGLRAGIVTPDVAPTMADVRDTGVNFANSHSMFPTLTMPNASAFATGHGIGDSGIFGNTLFAGTSTSVAPAAATVTPFIENDFTLRDLNGRPQGFIAPETVLAAARRAGFSTAAIGKMGPVGLQDIARLGAKPGQQNADMRGAYVFDDSSGNIIDSPNGPLQGLDIPPDLMPLVAAKVGDIAAPERGANGSSGDCDRHGTRTPNLRQGRWFADVAAEVVLPRFKDANKPFFMVFWSRDPDGTQHNNGDSFGKTMPGINGETSLRAITAADDNLRELRRALHQLGLENSTDIIIAADHGFSTISKESKTSSAHMACAGDDNALPVGFVALDLAKALKLPLTDPDRDFAPIDAARGEIPLRGQGVLGTDPKHPDAVIVSNGGNDLIYLPGANRAALAARMVEILAGEDYVSGLFADDALGKIPGALQMSSVGWKGAALTQQPAIVVNFRSFATNCGRDPLLCAATVADTTLTQGQGQHGSFNRADTANFMAAAGPDFRPGFKDQSPASNADIGATIAHILGLTPQITGKNAGKLNGRVLTEAMPGGQPVAFEHLTLSSSPGPGGLATVLNYQKAGNNLYFDAAGYPGRTVGLTP